MGRLTEGQLELIRVRGRLFGDITFKWAPPLLCCSVQYNHRGAQSKYQVQTSTRGAPHQQVQAIAHSTQGATEREISSVGLCLCRLSEAGGENVTQRHGLGLGNGRVEVSQRLYFWIRPRKLTRISPG